MSKPLSYYVDLVRNANTENLPARLERYRAAYENSNKPAETNQGGTQSSTPLLPIRQQVSLPGPTNNQLSNAILMPNNVQVKANQAMIQQGLQPAYLGQAPTITQPQPLPDPSTLQRIGSGATGVVKSMSATIPMFVDTAAQTLENRNKDSQNHFYTDAYKEYQNLYNQIETYKKQHPDSVRIITKPDPTDPRGVRKITVTEYSPELQVLMNAMKEKEDFMNLQRDTTPVSSDSLGMEMYRDANKDKEYALQGLDATGRFLGSTLMSIGQNALTLPFATVNPALSLGMMSANAASDRMGELNEQRVSAGEALGRGLLSGGIEAFTEKVSIESLLDIAKKAPETLRQAIKTTLQQAGTEASEEAVSYTLNALADYAAADPEAEFNIRGLLESAAGGALSGGLMGGGANLVGYAKGSNNVSFEDSKQAVTLPLGQQLVNNDINQNSQIDTIKPQLNQENLSNEQIDTHKPQPLPTAKKPMYKTIPLAPDYAAQLVGQDTYNTLQQIAKKANTMVSIVQGTGYDGYYQDGRIYINVNSDKPVLTTMKHELTHHIETSDSYSELQQMMMNEYSRSSKQGVERAIKNIQNDYADRGIVLNYEDARHEFAAKYVEEKLFTDEASIKKLYQEQPNLFKRIYEWIKDSIKYVRSSNEQRALMKMEKMYTKAMDETVKKYVSDTNGNKIAYSINKPFSEQVDDVLNGTFDKTNMLFVTNSNAIMQKVLGNDYPVLMTPYHIESTYFSDGNKKGINYHGYGELIKQIPEALQKPIMIIQSSSKLLNNAIFITEIKDKNGHNMIAPIDVDTSGMYNNIQIDANVLDTFYAKDDSKGFLEKITGDDILYLDNKKSQQLFNAQGLQLPNRVKKLDGFIHSVRKSDQKVNYQMNGNYKTDMQIALEKAGLLNSDQKPSMGKSLSDYDQMLKDYGAIKTGVDPARIDPVPKQTSDKDVTSLYARTLMESEVTPNDVVNDLKTEIANGKMSHEVISDKQSLKYAEDMLNNYGYQASKAVWNDIVNGHTPADKNSIALGQQLYNQAINSGNTAEAMKIASELSVQATKAGQNVQAFSLLKKMTPDGQLYSLQTIENQLNQELSKKYGNKAQPVKIKEGMANDLLNSTSHEEMLNRVDNIKQDLADQMPANWMEKWNAWRYLSMLGNPRTHVRNIVGNALFMPMKQMKDIIGYGLENAYKNTLGTDDFKMSKSLLSKADQQLVQWAKSDYEQYKDAVMGENGKYQDKIGIERQKRVFKSNVLEWLKNFNFTALEKEDAWFSKYHYANSLAQYLKANQIDPNTASITVLDEARNYAVQEAQKATYRDNSYFAQCINNMKNKNKLSQVIGEGFMPFTKTPMNILQRGMEYSPAGVVKGVYDMLTNVQDGKMTPNQAIDEIASGLTGTGLFLLGSWLSYMGILTSTGDDDDKKKDKFDQAMGAQDYAIKIGDVSYTVDWAAPSSMPIFMGASLFEDMQNQKGFSVTNFIDSAARIAEPIIDMSMLQGISSTIKTAGYSDSPLTDILINMSTSYLSQGVPTLLGQITNIADGTRRDPYYVDKNSPIPQILQIPINRALTKIPFANQLVQPKLDVWGNEQKDSLPERIFENTLSPGYISTDKRTDLEKELERLYKINSDYNTLPSYPSKYYTVNGETKNLTAAEYDQYSKEVGQTSHELLEDTIYSAYYKKASDELKANLINDVYEYAKQSAKLELTPGYKADKWVTSAMEADKVGIEVDDFIYYNNIKGNNSEDIQKMLNDSGLSRIQKAYMYRVLTSSKKNPYE
ncbi:hypothetical protein [Dielma fastidiosa]|uniref:Phage MuF C-terminal domain-containing protein n=1 Tax=Dielma fastidiosa TaxID=1034346 RepID=A0A318L9Z0_9FIRM|nr:hypothetical protein [Dielma fastidiosa]PXX78487.1 hypothetical protein DES51_10727 [Dielma fastidiosa]